MAHWTLASALRNIIFIETECLSSAFRSQLRLGVIARNNVAPRVALANPKPAIDHLGLV